MATNNSLNMKFAYHNTEQTRSYKFDGIADSLVAGIKDKIIAVNNSLAGGTAGGLSSFFVSDDGDFLLKISEAEIRSTETTNIPL